MDSRPRTVDAVRDWSGPWEKVAYWVLLSGNRLVLAAGIVLGVVGCIWLLISQGVLAVGAGSYAATLFGSGLASGVVTLLTVSLSINQLILSRVFGSPNELMSRLTGTQELRTTVEELAEQPSSPTDPASFLSMVGATLATRTDGLRRAIEASDWSPPAEVSAVLSDVADYGRSVDDHLEAEADIVDVLHVVIGPEYAWNMTAVHHLQNEYADSLAADVESEFQAVHELLESVAVARQFFKTLSIQQDFANLSRLLVYSGLTALLVTAGLTLMYRTNATTLPAAWLPLVVSVGFGVVVSPLATFVAYLLRAATIAYRTVSVGPFVPPSEQ